MGLAMTGRRILSKDKVEASIDLADTLLEGEDSVVIVSEFDETLDKIQEKYGDLCCTIRGGMTDKAKQQAIDDFQSGTKKVCALNMIAGGVGITLTKAHHMIICDYDWTPSNMAQVEDRICRSGQKDPCMIHYIYCENALLDQIFMKMITDKSYNIDRIVDKAENTMDFNVSDGNYLKTLENCINELKENRLRKIFENNFSNFHYEITSSPFGCDIFIDDKQLHLSRTKLYDIINENTDEEITQKISDAIIQFQNELEIDKE
jgi:SNF2 family DNA or RNA helicase